MVLMVQREVAERLAATPGQMSLLSVSSQLYYEPKLGGVVPAELFEPPPKVDSRVITLHRRQPPLFGDLDTKIFFRIVKAGFAGRRKKLRGSLSAGLGIDKAQADILLEKAGINGDLRAQNLSLADWHKLYTAVIK
jgi:16S rRNA (adenine1518-N6/adenine1519-N6)-dimethyltransferase